MRGLSSSVLSVAAMALSTLTTYLTFFDASYTLTSAVASVSIQISSGGGYSPENGTTATYQFYPEPSVILSNRGTLPIVVSDVQLVMSKDFNKCVPGDDFKQLFASGRPVPTVIEPETVRQLSMKFPMKTIDAKAPPGSTDFNLQPGKELWCLKWTIFDPNGRRQEPLMPLFTIDYAFEHKEGDRRPSIKVKKDFPKGPMTLIARGVF